MPIYRQTYRSFEGAAPGRFRWLTVARQELGLLNRNRIFLALVILGYIHFFFRVLQVMVADMIMTDPHNPLTAHLRHVALLAVDKEMIFDFLRLQAPMTFLMSIYVGAGMICEDARNNLLEVYFSKPLRWMDYVIGKIVAVLAVGMLFTAVQALLLTVLHNVLASDWTTLRTTYWWPLSIVGFSLVLTLPCALGVLASSALSSTRRYASIAVFIVLFTDLVVGRTLPLLMHERSYAIIAFPLALNRIGELLFMKRRPLFDLSWQWSAIYFAVLCAVLLWIICRKVRRAEIAV